MPRIKTVNKDFFYDESVALMSYEARLTLVALWLISNDSNAVPKDHEAIRAKTGSLLDGVDLAKSLEILRQNKYLSDSPELDEVRPSEGMGSIKDSRLPTREWMAIRDEVFARDGYICCYCGGKDAPFHVDHRTPISKGGSDGLENLCVACRRCNIQKKDKSVDEFNAWRANR